MIRIYKNVILLLFLLFFITNSFAQDVIIDNGYIDLTNIDLDNNTIELKGQWDFYWREFLLPNSIDDSLKGHKKYLAKVPKTWQKVKLDNDNYCTSDGFATYRLRIRVKNKDEIYAIKLGAVFTAYRLYANGELLTSIGTAGKTKETSVPRYLTQEIPIQIFKKEGIDSQVIDLVFHISNFYHRRASLKEPVYFGKLEKIIDNKEKEIVLEVLLIGIILVIGFNHILMYFFNRVNFSNLLFGLLSIIMMVRILSTQERILLYFFPNMNWEFLVKLDNFSGFGTTSFFAIYFFYSFRKDFPKIILYIFMALGMIITVLVFSTPVWFYGQFRLILEAYVGIGGLYLTFGVLLVAALRKRERALMTFIAMFGLFGTAIYDVLNSMEVINSSDIAPYGIAWFMTIQSYLLTKESAKDRKENKRLSKELEEEKLHLEDNIEERINEIQSQSVELEKFKVKQEQLNWVNDGLNELIELMREGRRNMKKLAEILLPVIVKKVDANIGAMYIYYNKDGEEKLRLISRYGSEKVEESIYLGEGLIGQTFVDGKNRYISDLPKDYLTIASGLGDSKPQSLAVLPMKIDQLVIGVIELASFGEFTDAHKQFLERALENVSSQLNIFRMNDESLAKMMQYKLREEKTMSENRQLKDSLNLIKEEVEMLRRKEESLRKSLEN
jgi:putative methionine-R-sulfoxide reductase with GAF domain